MNTRQREILRMLLGEPGRSFVVRDLAASLSCSEKTIRNDFEAIDAYLAEQGKAKLLRKPGIGVDLDIEEHERVKLFDQLFRSTADTGYERDDNRIAAIAYELLMNTKPTTLQELAEKYYVNRAIIKRDLDSLNPWLHKRRLEIVSKQRVGILIEGAEKDKRAALSKVSLLIETSTNDFIKKRFEAYEIDLVTRELKRLERKEAFHFTDEAFENLLIHTLLMIRRTKLNQPISFSEQEQAFIREKREYQWTLDFIRQLERYFSVHFPSSEAAYLTAHLLGAKIRSRTRLDSGRLTEHPLKITAEVTEVVQSLMRKMSSLTFIDFERDLTLKEGLSIHLSSTIHRLSYGLSVTNPLLQDIKKMYPYMFSMVIYATNELGHNFQFTVPEDEVAYLTLHFQAAIERLNKQTRLIKNIVTVCHMGVGISQILRTKLERKFSGIQVMDSVRRADLNTYLEHHPVDFIVSTIPLNDIDAMDIPHIVVSPLLEPADVKKITNFLERLEEHPLEASASFLQMYTKPALIFSQVEVSHRFEIIEQLANSLHAKGYVEQDYAHQALLRERVSATTIGGGIAIPHGDPKLVKQSQIAIATLKEPLEWEQDKVSIVFMLALRNQEQENTKKLFHRLSLLSEQPSLIQQLIRAKEAEDIFSLL
ncbi:BglG family transcription antiterminator [Paenibacillus bouchesdurhonensis]|uniref:BglG family transcription antiterminator n=1 Tax=Paenibacillus bouchesdurhonensis TaxID=1870990 RepID=UPI000DA62F0A|nr:BglG family transcription antiterminator [Paenibacillus bouchesdurhonensis]